MSGWAARRFWREVTVREGAGGFEVLLDSRPLRTPAKAALVLPTRALADDVASEWAAQGERIDPGAMPATRRANSAIDRVAPQREAVIAEIAGFGATDLVCYRAEAPAGLAEQQAARWDPLVAWAADALGARLAVTAGIMPLAQPEDTLARLHQAVAAHTEFELTGLHDLVALSGSLVIGLAAAAGAETPEALWEASRVDEAWQIALWGEDAEAAEANRLKRQAFLEAERFFRHARGLGSPPQA